MEAGVEVSICSLAMTWVMRDRKVAGGEGDGEEGRSGRGGRIG